MVLLLTCNVATQYIILALPSMTQHFLLNMCVTKILQDQINETFPPIKVVIYDINVLCDAFNYFDKIILLVCSLLQ
jgi:ABC-type enterochelin transport system ATPase subunit